MNRNDLLICLLVFFCLMPITADAKCIFKGGIDLAQNNFDLELNFSDNERLAMQLNFLPENKFTFDSKLEHIRLLNSYISTELTSEGEITKDAKGDWTSFNGKVNTNYSLLNFKPISELTGDFQLTKNNININSLLWGNLKISGKIYFDASYKLDLIVDIVDMDINELALLLGLDLGKISMSGLVSGKVKIEGSMAAPKINGQLRASVGNIDTLRYNEILVNIQGVYPILKFIDSNVFEKDGYVYALSGSVNVKELDNLNSANNKVQVTPLAADDFGWDSWKLSRKKFYSQDDALELEYELKEDRPFKMRLREDEEILSLEHSLRF